MTMKASKVWWKICQTAGPIGTKFGTHLQIHLGMDTPNKLPLETQGGVTWGGGFRGKHSSMGKLSNGWTDWHQLWFTCTDSSGNGHRLNTIHTTMTQGHFGVFRGSQIQMFGEAIKRLDRCQTAGPIGTKFDTNLRIRLGIDIDRPV